MTEARERITRDDLEAKFRELTGEVGGQVEAARPQMLTVAAAGVLLAVVLAYLLGRRSGRKRSTVVEIRRV